MDSTMYFLSGEAMCDTPNPARELISSKVGTGDAGLEFCAPLLTQQRAINRRKAATIKGENRVLLRGRFRKTK
jgi:hypothetical protein